MLQFSNFQFDYEQQILYKQGNVITLTANQAKLLGLFLSRPEKIFSKDEILDWVWSGRSVSEQVVFQNISQLRAIFSDAAIKTFPKRGYQWQITVENKNNAVSDDRKASESALQQTNKMNTKKWQFICLLVLFVFICSYMVYQESNLISPGVKQPNQTDQQANIVLLPFATRTQGELDTVKAALNHTLAQKFTPAIGHSNEDAIESTAWSFFNSPYMVRKQLLSSDDKLLLSGIIHSRTLQDSAKTPSQYILEYLIQGERRQWQGYLLANNAQDLTAKLVAQVQLITHSQYFDLASNSFTTAELSLLQSKHPENLDILKHLIERLLIEDSYDEASARSEQMLSQSSAQQHPVYIAYAIWLKGKLLLDLKQYSLAQTALEQANQLIASANFLALQSEINKSLANIPFANNDFEHIKHYLYQSASQARLANRPVQEIRAYTLLSIYASSLGLHQQKYDYLNKAKTLLGDYKLDGSHYMLIYYHFALFAEIEAERKKYYLQILQQPVTPKNYWIYFKTSNRLTNLYISQKKWQQALELANNITEPARHALIKSKIFRAQGRFELASQQAQAAFNSARTQRIDWIGLDMALMLLELINHQSNQADILLYKRYIKNTANTRWAEQNKIQLGKVGIVLDPYGSSAIN